jgi:type I restriction enzyme R subunit
MKGRGTRLHTFKYIHYANDENEITENKTGFKLIDFFAVCEYFNEKYDYKAALSVPKQSSQPTPVGPGPAVAPGGGTTTTTMELGQELGLADKLKTADKTVVGKEGMVIDREMFREFVEEARQNEELRRLDNEDPAAALRYLKNNVLEKPNHYMTLDKIKKHFKLDRRIGLGEALDIIMGRTEQPKPKAEIIAEQFEDFMITKDFAEKLSEDLELYHLAFHLFDAYISADEVRSAIDKHEYARLEDGSHVSIADYTKLHQAGLAEPIINYIRDYVDVDKLKG